MTHHPESSLLWRTVPDIPGAMTVCCFCFTGGTCSHIPQPEHGSNTNKDVGGECVSVFVDAFVQGGVFVTVFVFPAVASAGATGRLDPVCVLQIVYKVTSELQTALICVLCFIVSVGVFVPLSQSVYVYECVSVLCGS